jgi:hypothetical protein
MNFETQSRKSEELFMNYMEQMFLDITKLFITIRF